MISNFSLRQRLHLLLELLYGECDARMRQEIKCSMLLCSMLLLRKIFNRNTIKISYSCMNNTKQIIDNHNKRILTASTQIDNTAAATIDNNKTCNCRQKNTCPLDGNCLQSSVIYQATVTRKDNNTTETYIGLTENDFKTRYRNHTASFRHAKHRNSTELSKHIWTLKDNFANIFMAKIEKGIISKSIIKPLVWKRYIDDVFCLWDTNEDNIKDFVTRANHYHDTIKFTAEISDSEIAFLDTKVYKGERFNRDSTLDVQTHYKQTETFQYTNFYSCHPPGVKKGFIKGEALRLLRTNSSHSTFNKNMQSFKTRLKNRGYPNEFLEKHLFEVNFKDRKRSLGNKDKSTKKKILPFITQYHPALPNVKNILIGKWHLIQNQPYLKEVFQEPPILSYRKGKSLKDTLVRAKL